MQNIAYTHNISVYIIRQAKIDKRTKPFCFYEWYWLRLPCICLFLSRVSMLCVHSAILFYQFSPSVCLCSASIAINKCTYRHIFI